MQPADVHTDREPSSDRREDAGRDERRWFRARTGLVILSAFLTELIVVAATGNQGVTDAVNRHLGDHSRSFADYAAGAWRSLSTYHWRFTPASGQSTGDWAADFAAIGVLFVLTVLLLIPIVRGAAGFWRVFFGAWVTVAAITPIAIMVRNAIVIPSRPGPGESKFGQAVYGYPDFGTVIVGGIVLGLLTGLVGAVVARTTRREVSATGEPLARRVEDGDERYERYEESEGYLAPGQPGYPPPQPPPFYGMPSQPSSPGQPGGPTSAEQWTQATQAGTEQPTTALPSMEPDQPTTTLPPAGENPPADWYGYDQPTTNLPPQAAETQTTPYPPPGYGTPPQQLPGYGAPAREPGQPPAHGVPVGQPQEPPQQEQRVQQPEAQAEDAPGTIRSGPPPEQAWTPEVSSEQAEDTPRHERDAEG